MTSVLIYDFFQKAEIMDIPTNPNISYVAVVLFLLGLFLFLSGIKVIQIEKVTVSSGFKTWLIGIILMIVGSILGFSKISINNNQKNAETSQEIDSSANLSKFNSDIWYRFTNNFLKDTKALDITNDKKIKPVMSKLGNYSGQYWKIKHEKNGYYRLTNRFLGERKALSISYSDKNKLIMAETRNDSAQYWSFLPVNNGQYRITNKLLEKGSSLDTHSGTENSLFMGTTGKESEQMWTLSPIK